MKRNAGWLIVSFLVMLALVLSSCAPAAVPAAPTAPQTPAATATPKAPITPTAPTTPAAKVPSPVSGQPKYGGTINWYMPDAGGADPYRYDSNSMRFMTVNLEKLIMADWARDRSVYEITSEVGYVPPIYMTEGQLLESWELPDPLSFKLHVRKGVRFQNKPPVNGRELVADDIVWTYQRMIKSAFTKKDDLKRIDTVKALDKYTVEIKLKPPPTAESWTGILDMQAIMVVAPEVVGRQLVEFNDWRMAIGTGPFSLEDWVPNSMAFFKKNPDYWGYDELHPTFRLPYADAVRVFIVPDRGTLLAAVRSGKIDIVTRPALSWEELQGIKKFRSDLQFKPLPHSTPRIMKPMYDKAPYNDVRVRQAINMAINREEIVKTVFSSYAIPYTSSFDPVIHSWLFTPYDKLPDKPMWTKVSVKDVLSYNPEKAKQLLAEAGYPNGFSTWVDDTIAEDPWGYGELVASYLSKIGVKMEVKMMEYAAYETLKYGYKNEQLVVDSAIRGADPFIGLRAFVPGISVNFGRVNDARFTEMYNKALVTLDEKKRDEMLLEMGLYSLENAFTLALPHPQVFNVWQPWLKGYQGEASRGLFNYGATISHIWIDTGK